MNNHPYPADLYWAVYDQLEYNKDPGCGEEAIAVIEIVEEHFKEGIAERITEAWQDGHDTALINGQSQNPYQDVTGSPQDDE